MTNIRNIIKCVAFVIMLASFFVCPVSAREVATYHGGGSYGGYHGGYGGYHGGYRGWYGGYHGGWYYGGWWYPWAVIIPALPVVYETIWIGGYPYYYANGLYYAPTTGGYMVVNPPQGEANQPPPMEQPSTQVFIYPRKGQSEQQQAKDRYECHSWAVSQTGYDPTQPAGGVPSVQKRADYQRAMSACLDARGYSAK
jgi:hypothetical protein